MSTRQEVQELIVKSFGNPTLVDELMNDIDPLINELIGKDDTEDDTDFPKTWNVLLKKQYINFRNHLRRAMRTKWRG